MDVAAGFTSINPAHTLPTVSSSTEPSQSQPSITTTAAAAGTKRKRSPKTTMKFYAVRVGKEPGIYHSWAECLEQVRGYPKAVFKSFPSLADAQAFLVADDRAGPGGAFKNGAHGASASDKFYGVQQGRVPGVYASWPEVLEQITGWRFPKHKVFKTRAEAEMFVNEGRGDGVPPPIHMVMGSGEAENGADSGGDMPKAKKAKTTSRKGDGQATASPGPSGDVGNEYEPGEAPLPADAEDGFDSGIILDQTTGTARYKTAAEFARTKYQATGPAPEAPIRIYTDGSTLSNGRVDSIGGVGVYFGPKDKRNISEPLSGSRQTNQRAELTAILRALEVAPRDRTVVILSDSNYAIKCVTEWFQKWRSNGWTTAAHKPVENRDLIQKVVDMLDERMRLNKHRMVHEDDEDGEDLEAKGPWERGPAGVKFTWVKGHAKDEGNSAADELAVNGARTARELGEEVILD